MPNNQNIISKLFDGATRFAIKADEWLSGRPRDGYPLDAVRPMFYDYRSSDPPKLMFNRDRERYLAETGDIEGYNKMEYDEDKYAKIHREYQDKIKRDEIMKKYNLDAISYRKGGSVNDKPSAPSNLSGNTPSVRWLRDNGIIGANNQILDMPRFRGVIEESVNVDWMGNKIPLGKVREMIMSNNSIPVEERNAMYQKYYDDNAKPWLKNLGVDENMLISDDVRKKYGTPVASYALGDKIRDTNDNEFNPGLIRSGSQWQGYANIANSPNYEFAKKLSLSGLSKPSYDSLPGYTKPLANNPIGDNNPMKRGFADWANIGLGAYGLASSLSAKKPQLERPREYRSVIKPATGNQNLLQATMNNNAMNANQAGRDIKRTMGSNISGYTQGRLAINDQRNKADAGALMRDAEIYRGEQDRVYGQLNQDKQFNYENNRRYDEAMYAQRMNEWAGRQQQGQAMLQNSINYEQQRSADLQNKAIMERQFNSRLDMMGEGSLYDQASRLVIAGHYPNMKVALEDLRKTQTGAYDKYKTNNYQNIRR